MASNCKHASGRGAAAGGLKMEMVFCPASIDFDADEKIPGTKISD